MSAEARPEHVIVILSERGERGGAYRIAIEPLGDGFVVTFAYGRPAGGLVIGARTIGPVAYASAKALFDKLVSGLVAEGSLPVGDLSDEVDPGAERAGGNVPT
jgi:bifunctional non-homologous end joining protein LigD